MRPGRGLTSLHGRSLLPGDARPPGAQCSEHRASPEDVIGYLREPQITLTYDPQWHTGSTRCRGQSREDDVVDVGLREAVRAGVVLERADHPVLGLTDANRVRPVPCMNSSTA